MSGLTETEHERFDMATNTLCAVNGCGNKRLCRDLCSKHYQRMRIYGNPTAKAASLSRLDNFFALVFSSNTQECIEWPFAKIPSGYGHMGARNGEKYAHRFVCASVNGACPQGKECAHTCGNSSCVNPHHLRWATRSENAEDKRLHGTLLHGESHTNSKLTASQVMEIRQRCGTGLVSQKKIAQQYNISAAQVSDIHRRVAWAHLK